MRIVSLLPSATEIVCALGLGETIVGVSHECDFPEDAKTKTKIIEPVLQAETLDSCKIDALVIEHMKQGRSLYRIKIDELRRVNPDLIITQELCDVCAVGADDVREAAKQLGKSVSVLTLDPHTLQDVKNDILKVGGVLGRTEEATNLVIELDRKSENIRQLTRGADKRRVFCAEWLNPLMNAGHWVPEMVENAGGVDGLARRGEPSAYVDWGSVADYDPEILVLMPCGFTTRRTIAEAEHLLNLKEIRSTRAIREGRVYATDGHNYFSRSGPRLFDGIGILAQMIHPELFSEPLDSQLGVRMEALTARV